LASSALLEMIRAVDVTAPSDQEAA
jgi:hypothetical protein